MQEAPEVESAQYAEAEHGFCHINQLPPEVLIEIFKHLVGKAESSAKKLSRMLSVCKMWTAVAEATPSLWTSISTNDPQEVYLRCIAWSTGCPLHLQLNWSANATVFGSAVRAACENASRWSSVKIQMLQAQGHEIKAGLQLLCEISVPLLEELSIDVYPFGGRAHMDLFAERPQKLRHLSLHNFKIYWGSDPFPNLQTLNLAYEIRVGLRVSRIMTILSLCPQLTNLTLSYRSPDSVPNDTTSINLNSLRSINLKLDTPALHYFLEHLRISNCLRFLCETNDNRAADSRPILFTPEMEHLGPIIARGAHSSTRRRVEIKYPARSFTYTAYGVETGTSETRPIIRAPFMIPDPGYDRDLDRLFHYIPLDASSSPVEIEFIQAGPWELDPERFNSVASRLDPRVHSLIIRANPLIDTLMTYLSKPSQDAQGVLRWRFPNMKKLSIGNASHQVLFQYLAKAKEMLTGRASFSNESGHVQGASHVLPEMLEELAFFGTSPTVNLGPAPDELHGIVKMVGTAKWGLQTIEKA